MVSSLSIRFDPETSASVRSRITYALQVFAAVYGYAFGEGGDTIYYGKRATDARPEELFVPALYKARPITEPVRRPIEIRHEGELFHLFHDVVAERPDFLGEIFEWLSAADERSIRVRDEVGRIPYAKTIFRRYAISPLRAHASRMMAWLAAELRRTRRLQPPGPFSSDVAHAVVCSHDLDFYFTSRIGTLARLGKNLVLAAVGRNFGFLAATSRQLGALAAGRKVGDFLPRLQSAARTHGFRSTAFVISQSPHRRDANYSVGDIAHRLRDAGRDSVEIGLHGSYTSVVEKRDLVGEVATLRAAVDAAPRGNRQHWLRFDAHEQLYGAIERAGFQFDSTLAFREASGFRNGACCPFPPYDFERERPCDFLEIPLAIMDTTLADRSELEARQVASEVLRESRRWGWGGISVLWHNPCEPLGVPAGINEIFWELLQERVAAKERWMSGGDLLNCCLGRYHAAGLLCSIHRSARVLASCSPSDYEAETR